LAEKIHDGHEPGCPQCNAGAADIGDEVCTCLTGAYAEGLKRWQQACACCFESTFPQGLEAAFAAAGE